MTSPPSFSLLSDPWIDCTTTDGANLSLGIRDIFTGAHPVREVRGDSPTQDYAVLRVLLAIFWRAHHPDTRVGPGETFSYSSWAINALATTDGPDEAVLDYLERYRNRFDLLDPIQPFMQVADLRTPKNTTFSVKRIIPEAEGDFFTMRAGQGRGSLGFAEAARWLIHTQAYDYSGIKSGAVGDPRVKGGRGYPIGTGWTGRTGGTVVLGEDLRQTLVRNTTLEALIGGTDRPVWERNQDTAAERHLNQPEGAGETASPQGPADLATWQGRRVRLFAEGERITAVLVSNGDRIPDAGANVLDDPMTPYRYSPNQSKKGKVVHYALPYDTNRTMWRALEPLIALDEDPAYDGKKVAPIRPKNLSQIAELEESGTIPPVLDLNLVSMSYGPQDSSVGTTVSARIELPVALLAPEAGETRATVLDTARVTHEAAVALGQFAGQLLQAAGHIYEFRADPTDAFLAEIEPRFITWLGRLDTIDINAHAGTWQEEVRSRVLERAAELMRGAGPSALVGREVKASPGESRTMLLSAGTAYRMLQGRLKKILYLTHVAQKS